LPASAVAPARSGPTSILADSYLRSIRHVSNDISLPLTKPGILKPSMQKTFAIGCKNCANRLYALAKYKSMPIGLARKESDFGSTY